MMCSSPNRFSQHVLREFAKFMFSSCRVCLFDGCTLSQIYFRYCSSLTHTRSRDTCEQPLDHGDGPGGVKRARYERYERWNDVDEEQEGTVTFSLISTSFFTVKVNMLRTELRIIRVRLRGCYAFASDERK